jgi:hypothetical protein
VEAVAVAVSKVKQTTTRSPGWVVAGSSTRWLVVAVSFLPLARARIGSPIAVTVGWCAVPVPEAWPARGLAGAITCAVIHCSALV